MLTRRTIFLSLAAGGLMSGTAARAQTGAVRSLFIVGNVAVDARADSSAAAQTIALASGKKLAFDRLLTRLTFPDTFTAARLRPVPDTPTLEKLIARFSVSDERRSNVRYLATLLVEFDAVAVRTYLRDQSVIITENRAPPIGVYAAVAGLAPTLIPGLEAALRGGNFEYEPVPLAYLGLAPDPVTDLGAIERAARTAGNGAAAILAVAVAEGADLIKGAVRVTKIEGGASFDLGTLQVQAAFDPANGVAARDRALAEMWRKLALSASDALQVEFKQRVRLGTATSGKLVVEALYGSLTEWNTLKARLGKSSIIRSISIDAITLGGALLTLTFSGSDSQLRDELTYLGLVIESTAYGDVLRLPPAR